MPKCRKCGKQAEPKVISDCCTELFCKSCADELIKSNSKCPFCKRPFAEIDGSKELQVNDYSVTMDCSCPEEDAGCTWTGTMDDLDGHLKICDYSEIECDKCEEDVRRMDMKDHLANECPKREVNCKHCHYKGPFSEITGSHLKQCPEILISCPNGCGATFKRVNLQAHLSACQKSESKTQAKELDDLRKRVTANENGLEQVTVSAAEFKGSQQLQKKRLDDHERRLKNQDKALQDQTKKDTAMKERLDKVSSDQGNLRKQQQDQQAKVVEQGKAIPKLEKQFIDQQISIDAVKKQQAEQGAKMDTRLANHETRIGQQETKMKEQQAKITEQLERTTRLEACIEEQRRVDESLKQSIARLEKELRKQQEICKKQELDRQSKLMECQKATTKLENQIQLISGSTQSSLARLEAQQSSLQDQINRLEQRKEQQAKLTQEVNATKLEAEKLDQTLREDLAKLEQGLAEQKTVNDDQNTKIADHEARIISQQTKISRLESQASQSNVIHTAPAISEPQITTTAQEIKEPAPVTPEPSPEASESEEEDQSHKGYMIEVMSLLVGSIICGIFLIKINRAPRW